MIDLHCHMDGSLSQELIIKLADMQGVDIPKGEQLEAAIHVDHGNKSLVEYLEKFNLPLKLLSNKEALILAAYDVFRQAAAEGVLYMELRYAPLLHVQNGLDCRQVIEAVITGIRQAKEEFGIMGASILCAMRHMGVDENLAMYKIGRGYLGEGVCGVDIAGDEMGFPAEQHSPIFDYARREHIPITIHAGECGSAANVIKAIELGACRIGHGVSAINDERAMKACFDAGIPLELCPISNMHTKAVDGWHNYPIAKFLKRGIRATVNTDNRTVSNTTIKKEFAMLNKHALLPDKQKKQLLENAVNAAFADDSIKIALLKSIDKYIANGDE